MKFVPVNNTFTEVPATPLFGVTPVNVGGGGVMMKPTGFEVSPPELVTLTETVPAAESGTNAESSLLLTKVAGSEMAPKLIIAGSPKSDPLISGRSAFRRCQLPAGARRSVEVQTSAIAVSRLKYRHRVQDY